jgi:predicted XRE-type DNA-binding protein
MNSKTNNINSSDLLVTMSSGNVFADLGLPNPEEMLLKAELSKQIYIRLHDRQLAGDAAVDFLGLEIAQVEALMLGKATDLSIEQLFRVLNALDCDVEIIVKNRTVSNTTSSINVTV